MTRPLRLTPRGYQRLQQDHQHVCEQIEEARATVREQMEANEAESLGLVEAQERLAALEAQAAQLELLLDEAQVLDPADVPKDQVVLGSVALLTDVASGRSIRVRLVSPVEGAGVVDGVTLVSSASPVGAQLEGRRVGESFQVRLGSRDVQYTVTSLEPDTR
ncbi:GreA/GreB family elongation factor [Deinococcus sonorensis]|uniref:GreA/GreB family elongation factor n=2 Tax=Deinococcus sonorensis TaxID=309891 RepID=A0AAU7UFA5_9DEIO